MKPPRTRRMMLAWVFLALGAAFTLIGLLSFVISIPTRNGDARDFLPLGVLLLIAGSILALSAHWYSRTAARLQAEEAMLAELEAQVKEGKSISLMDLAAATHREEREKKQSVREKLKNQPKQEPRRTAPRKSAERER